MIMSRRRHNVMFERLNDYLFDAYSVFIVTSSVIISIIVALRVVTL